MYGHVPTLSGVLLIRKELIHKVPWREASLRKHALFPVLTENHILLGQRRGRAHAYRLLARGDHVETNSALPLRVEHDDVHDRHEQHILVQLGHLFIGQVRLEGRIHHAAVLVNRAVGGHGLVRGGLFELEGGCEGRFHGARELDVFRVGPLGQRASQTMARSTSGGRRQGCDGSRSGGEHGARSPERGRDVGEPELHRRRSIGLAGRDTLGGILYSVEAVLITPWEGKCLYSKPRGRQIVVPRPVVAL